jgi:hypothetical protein
VSLPAKSTTADTAPKAIIGVSLKMYFGYARTLDYCREVAAIALPHPAIQRHQPCRPKPSAGPGAKYPQRAPGPAL